MFERRSLGADARVSKMQYSGTTLKMIAAVMMIIGTFGVAILERVMDLDSYSTATLIESMADLTSETMIMSTLILLCLGIQSMAIPIYAVLLIEGFKNTKDIGKYAIRIAVLAIISEVPYDLAMHGQWIYWDEQNPVFGMLIALAVLYFIAYFDHLTKVKGVLLKGLVTVAGILWAMFLGTGMAAWIFVLVVAVLWLAQGNGAFTTFTGVVASLFQFPAPFGFIFTHFYNGEKGKMNRWVFYFIYPAQLLILGVIGKYLF